MSEPEPLPDLRSLTEGRYEATCGRCLRHSVPVAATSPENAWHDLQAIGWRWYVSEYGGRGYPECPTCAKSPPASTLGDNPLRSLTLKARG